MKPTISMCRNSQSRKSKRRDSYSCFGAENVFKIQSDAPLLKSSRSPVSAQITQTICAGVSRFSGEIKARASLTSFRLMISSGVFHPFVRENFRFPAF
jgi:hypothetical protein